MPVIESIAAMLGLVQAGKQAAHLVNGSSEFFHSYEPEPQPAIAPPPSPEEKTQDMDPWKEFKARDFLGMGKSLGAVGPNPSTYKSGLDRLEAEAESLFEDKIEEYRKALAGIENQIVQQRNLPAFLADTFEVQKKELQRLIELTQTQLEGVAKHEGPFKAIFRQFHDGFQQGVNEYNREINFLNNQK